MSPAKGQLQPRSLRARVTRVLRQSPLPVSTADLARICAPEKPHAVLRVRQVLAGEERRGRVRRLPPLPRHPDPQRGRPSLRWVLTSWKAVPA